MIIEVIPQKYNVGCGRGQNSNYLSELPKKLNSILEKEKSKVENDFEFKPGDCFLYEGTVFAIEPDKLIQILSETGVLAVERISECIEREYELVTMEIDSDISIKIEEYTSHPELPCITLDYSTQHTLSSRKENFKATISIYGLEYDLYFVGSYVYYTCTEEEAKYYSEVIVSHICKTC